MADLEDGVLFINSINTMMSIRQWPHYPTTFDMEVKPRSEGEPFHAGEEIVRLREEVRALKAEVIEMKEKYQSVLERFDNLWYAPGMPGAVEAAESFASASSSIIINK
jgi:hypothetical protein